MVKVTLTQLGSRAKSKRGDVGVRATAAEIGISPATLSRIERGHTPDLETFAKLCRWLGLDPGQVLGVESPESKRGPQRHVVHAHLRTKSQIDPDLAGGLAELILAAKRMLGEQ